MNKNTLICIEDIAAAAQVLRAINNGVRQDILHLLESEEKMTVTDMYERLRIDQSVCSAHLAILRNEGILGVERAAKSRYYYIIHKRMELINRYAKALLK